MAGRPLHLLLAVLSLVAFGTPAVAAAADPAANIHPEGTAKPDPGQTAQVSNAVVVRVVPYSDDRSLAPSRKIGDIRATVIDMHATELVADRDIASVVTVAMSDQFAASEFRLAGGEKTGGEHFQVSGSVRDFRLNIAGRDEVSIVVETTLRDAHNGNVVWSAIVSEKADRYAGVTGNTRNSITRYLNGALGTVTSKTVAQAGATMRQVQPALFNQAAASAPAVPGVTVIVAPPVAPTIQSREQPGNSAVQGRLQVATSPPRAKVYLGDVYYGLTPLKLDLEPGIYALRLKMDGFKIAAEKISVRKGETTELEVVMEK